MGGSDESKTIIIRPKVPELENDRSRYQCPVTSCSAVLKGIGFFPSHLKKVHDVVIKEGEHSNNKYCSLVCFCPVSSCKYGGQGDSDRCFTSLKLLRQHFMKVHAEKRFRCEKCGSSFGLDRDRRLHQGRCGQIYKCLDCEAEYSTTEALQTHCYRKGHNPPEKPPKIVEDKGKNKKDQESLRGPGNTIATQTTGNIGPPMVTSMPVILVEVTPQSSVEREMLNKSLSLKPLLPKPTARFIVPQKMASISNVPMHQSAEVQITVQERVSKENTGISPSVPVLCQSVSEGIQTSIGDKNLDTFEEMPSMLEKSWSSTGIQTAISIKPPKKKQTGTVAQTQTGDMILKKAMACADIPIQMESVGTQMTPQVKGQSSKRRKCTTETQTQINEGSMKSKKRRKSLLSEFRTDSVSQTSEANISKADSMCQVDNFRHVTLMDISKSSTTQAAQTDQFIRIDSMSQTKEGESKNKQYKLVDIENRQNLNGKSGPEVGKEGNSSSKSVKFKTRISAPGEGLFSDSETGPVLSVTEQETSDNRTESASTESLMRNHSTAEVNTTHLSQGTDTSISTQISQGNDASDLNASNGSKGHDMGIQTFEADFGRFILSQCEKMAKSSQMETCVQTQSTASDVDILLEISDRETKAPEMSMGTQTQTANMDVMDTWMNNMETQTSIDPAFDSFTFNDIETQTLPDISLNSSDDASFMNDFSLTSIQTQTMADDLYQSLSTQTDSFMEMFDFPLTSIHTQTTGQSDHASTQTNQSTTDMQEVGVGSDFTDVIYSSNTETQTTDLSLSNTQTQTAWDDLDNLLREFQK